MKQMFEDYFAVLPHNDLHGRVLFDAIREGVSPFKPKTINAYLEFDIDFNRYRIVVDVWFKDGYRLGHSEFMTADDLLDDTYAEMLRVSEAMFLAFRNREDYHAFVPKTVELGEN